MNNIKTDNSFSGEILVVEDDTANLKYMSDILTEANYQVRAANDGELALRSIQAKVPDLILLDINMPGMNGVEVCKRLKSNPATAEIPVIFISAEDKTDLKVKAFKAGGIDYVTKPIDPVEVLTRINTHLNMSRLQKQLTAQSEQMHKEIQERIKAEKKTKQFSLIFEESLNEIYLFDAETLKFNMVNKGAQNNMGYTLAEFQNLTPVDLKPEFTHESFTKLIEPLLKDEKRKIVFETIHKRKDQSIYPIEIHLQLMKYEQESLFAAIIIDITDRKKAEDKLIKSEKLYKEVQSLAHIGHWEYDTIRDRLLGSDEIYSIFGIDKNAGSLSIEGILQRIHPKCRDTIRKQVETGEDYRSDYRIIMDDGSIKFVHEDVIITRHKDGEIINMRGTAQDITKIKKAEYTLQKEGDKLKVILESMEDGVYIASKDYDIQYVNQALKKDFGSPEGKKCHEYLHDSDKPCSFCKNNEVFAGKTVQWEWTSPMNGRTYDLIDTPIINSDGSLSKLEIFRDITERMIDQKQIKASLKEKETLLSEIHHRVKNNMQVIISMLRLQAGKATDKEQVNMLRESENRVLSMAMVHEQLYQSQDFSNIDCYEYINNLVNDLFISYGINVNQIKLNISCKDTFLDIENAIPCGLIINELVSNALKYAFPDSKKGKLDISVLSVNKDTLQLRVSDNGVGIPENIDLDNIKSMGLNLVKVLSEETLEGKMELDRKNGTRFRFELKKAKYKSRT